MSLRCAADGACACANRRSDPGTSPDVAENRAPNGPGGGPARGAAQGSGRRGRWTGRLARVSRASFGSGLRQGSVAGSGEGDGAYNQNAAFQESLPRESSKQPAASLVA